MRVRFILVPTALIALCAIAGFVLATRAARGAATKRPITIAVEAPLSGSQSSNGRDMLRGVQLAVKEVNARGGVLGRKVRVLRADDRGDKANARAVSSTVIASDAIAVIGPYNSSVGIVNLPLYLRGKVVPIHLTSSDDTRAQGVTIQPKNSQIAPVEERYVRSLGARKVAMLVDDTANGAFTVGMATRLRQRLAADGAVVSWISIKEAADVADGYYAGKVGEALATDPDLVYVSSYYPEGIEIARALAGSGKSTRCLMGLANVDPAFPKGSGVIASQRCVFSGVPEAAQLASAATFVHRYRAAFDASPGVWGVFTYDSARMLFAAIRRERTTSFDKLLRALRHTTGYVGQTGRTTIDPRTGYRVSLPFLGILSVDANGRFVPRR